MGNGVAARRKSSRIMKKLPVPFSLSTRMNPPEISALQRF
jgi:hypothetical protein